MTKRSFTQYLLIPAIALATAAMGQTSTKAQTPANQPSTAQGQTGSSSLTDKQKESYALGMRVGSTFHEQNLDLDSASFFQGLKDAIAGGKTLLTEEEAQKALTQFQAETIKKQQEKAKQSTDATKKEGAAFLEANKIKAGVVTLPSGLQYKILQAGTGPKPKPTDTVVCNYRGTFIDGKEFDSSYKRGEPAKFPVGRVIKGWTEALQLMPVGSKWQLFIPSDLAYGDAGAGTTIPPGSTLVFEVELLSIEGSN